MNITEDYVSFEVAELLKEKKFDGLCYCHEFTDYEGNSTTYHTEYPENWNQSEPCVSIPTLGMAMKWLRGKHKVFIYIEPFITTSELQGYKPYCTKIGGDFMWINPLRKYSNTSSDTYEEAVEAALKYCLENLI